LEIYLQIKQKALGVRNDLIVC